MYSVRVGPTSQLPRFDKNFPVRLRTQGMMKFSSGFLGAIDLFFCGIHVLGDMQER